MEKNCITVEHPCPMSVFRLKTKDGYFYCNSCSKNIVDFRDRSVEEIKKLATKDTCGIFYTSQLHQPKFSFATSLKFFALTICSILGMQVSPLNAQSKPSTEKPAWNFPGSATTKEKHGDMRPIIFQPKVEVSKKSQTLSKRKKKKKKVTGVIGCPSF